MRFAAYAGTSMALATGVVFKALHSRANFYSACVYLSQSNACLMILSNLLLLVVGSILLGLQRLLYGPLRPIEIEQLYEKAWFAVTETCLAMTIFRDEVGAWFVVMFVSLLVGKVWGWIGEGRVEILEQQPPANPRLFHARLLISLATSLLFDVYLLKYSTLTVQQQARPNMMVMFAFEFAVLTVNSLSTTLRYVISLREAAIVQEQTKVRLQERRQEILREREEAAKVAAEAGQPPPEELPIEDVLDEADIDAPGWEEKSRWVFYLDLATDFVKLFLYLTFFCVLCMFYGMPIHIIRDVAITIRSFYKRITDFLKYRHATRDMNDRYPDATEADIRSQDVCIICREPMRVWQQSPEPGAENGPPPTPMDQRLRPKKLPCSHILHFACLRSWLERQQNCPTCRQPVLSSNPNSPTTTNGQRQGQPGQAHQIPGDRNGLEGRNRPADQNRIRFFNLGPIRLGFGAGNNLRDLEQQLENANPPVADGRNNGNVHQLGFSIGLGRHRRPPTRSSQPTPNDAQTQLQTIEQQLTREIYSLHLQQEQLQVVRALQGELARLRIANAANLANTTAQTTLQHSFAPQATPSQPFISALGANASQGMIRSGDSNMPPGVAIPDGWTLLPLRPLAELHNAPPPSGPSGTSNGTTSTTASASHSQSSTQSANEQQQSPRTSSLNVGLERSPASFMSTNDDGSSEAAHGPSDPDQPRPSRESPDNSVPRWSSHHAANATSASAAPTAGIQNQGLPRHESQNTGEQSKSKVKVKSTAPSVEDDEVGDAAL